MAYSKAPQPLIWFVSSSGYLIGLTYVPDQQIGAWHWHDTDGVFESCAVVAEGKEDVLYVVVKRVINGSTKRYVERMNTRQFANLEDAFFVDCGATYDGTNTTAVTMTVSGGTTWGPADALTITASAPAWNSGTNYAVGNVVMSGGVMYRCVAANTNQVPPNATYWVAAPAFAYPATTDVGDAIVLTDSAGVKYRLRIISTSSTTVAQARVDRTLPALRSTATAVWSFARNSISGLTWLEGKTVSILADGAVHPQQVVTSGVVNLERAASKVQVGLQYDSDLQTLPVALQVDAGFGQGRFKNVNKAWLRVFQSSGIFIGPDEANLVEAKQRTTENYGTPPALKTQELMVMLTPSWADSGQVYVRQQDPLPLTVVGLTIEVALGA
jgi:hypothetical protein